MDVGQTRLFGGIHRALLASALLWAGSAQAQVDQQNTVGSSAGSVQRIGQSFIPTRGSLNFATAFLNLRAGTGATVVAEVRAGAGFGGQLLGTSNSVFVGNTTAQSYTFSFAAPVTLAPGSTYTLRFTAVDPLTGTFGYGISSDNPYARGTAFDRVGDALADSDLIFSEGFNSAAPEPGSWALMIIGFGVVGGTLRRQRRVDAQRRTTFASA